MDTPAAHLAAPWYFSATQLKRADLCIRAWAWEKICGFIEPPGAAAKFGQDVHSVLEGWLSQGRALNQYRPTGKVAFEGLKWLPPPGPELEVEREFKIRIGKFHYRGFVDLGFMNGDGVPWVIDHKTTRDFMWALSVEALQNDIQALIYAKEAVDRYDTDRVHLRWVYYRTTEPFTSRITETTMTRQDIDCRWPIIDELAAETDKVRLTVLNPLELPPNANACAAFGGCPHQHRCNLSPREKRKSIMAQQDKKALLQRMQERKQNRDAATPSPKAESTTSKGTNNTSRANLQVAPDPEPAVVQRAAGDEIDAEEAELQAQMERLKARKEAAAKAKAEAARKAADKVKVNPPEQPDDDVQLSSDVNEGVDGREDGGSGKKTRQTKSKGFVVDDMRTAKILVVMGTCIGGELGLEAALSKIEKFFSE